MRRIILACLTYKLFFFKMVAVRSHAYALLRTNQSIYLKHCLNDVCKAHFKLKIIEKGMKMWQ